MKFLAYMDILSVVAECPAGVTAGQMVGRLAKRGRGVSKAQVAAALNSLVDDGLLHIRKEKYRANIDKKLYVMNEVCAILMSSIAREYVENERQMIMWDEVSNG